MEVGRAWSCGEEGWAGGRDTPTMGLCSRDRSQSTFHQVHFMYSHTQNITLKGGLIFFRRGFVCTYHAWQVPSNLNVPHLSNQVTEKGVARLERWLDGSVDSEWSQGWLD